MSRSLLDLHVGGLSQPVDVAPDRELLAQLLPDLVLHVLVADVALGAPAGDLHDDELSASARAGQREHRQHRARVRLADRLGVGLGQLVDRHVLRLALRRLVVVEPLQRVEGRARSTRLPDRVGLGPRAVDLDRVDVGHEQDVARLHLGRLHPLYLDDVVAERRLHRIRDHAGLERERHPLELGHHHAAAEPVERAALLARAGVLREALGGRGEVGAVPERQDDRVRLRPGARLGLGRRAAAR